MPSFCAELSLGIVAAAGILNEALVAALSSAATARAESAAGWRVNGATSKAMLLINVCESLGEPAPPRVAAEGSGRTGFWRTSTIQGRSSGAPDRKSTRL